MRCGERLGECRTNIDDSIDRQPAFRNEPIEWLSLDELHGEEVDAVGLLDGKYCNDVRVIERGHGSSFTLEAHETLRIAGHFGRQHLERHIAPQLRVSSAIYLAHTAGANRRRDVVMGERTVDQVKPPASRDLARCGLVSEELKPILH
jgi:hypothetical protein